MPRFSVSHWISPQASSPIWCSRTIHLDITDDDPSHLAFATVLALRHHECELAIKYNIVDSSGAHKILVPVLDTTAVTSSSSNPVGRPAVALCMTRERLVSPADSELAISLSVPVLITHYILSSRRSLDITFDTDEIETSRAGWFLIHIAEALHHIALHGPQRSPKDLFAGVVEKALLEGESSATRYDRWHRSFAPPVGSLLLDCFAERAKTDPLATAIAHADLQGSITRTSHVSYAAVLALSLQLAATLESVGVGVDDVVAICVEDIRHIAVSILAVLICGAAYIILDPGDTDVEALSTQSTSLPNLSAVLSQQPGFSQNFEPAQSLPFVDPGKLVFDESIILTLRLPSTFIRPLSVQPSATAYFTPSVNSEGRKTWIAVTHEEGVHDLKKGFYKFGAGSDFRLLHLFTVPSHFLGLNIWHTFMHRSALCFIPQELESGTSTSSLVHMTGCTHLAVPRNQVENASALVCRALEDTEAESLQAGGKLPLRTLVVPRLPLATWNKLPLAQTKIQLMVHEEEDPSSVYQLPEKPSEIVLLYQKQDTDLTPLHVLALLPKGNVIHDMGPCIVQITESLAVKYGRSVSELEARNMLYVLERTSIPIPDVHLVFKQGNITYIIMQFIHGPTVQNCWHMLDASQRHSVASQLVRYIDDLHCSSVSAPSNKPGPLDGGKCEGPWFTFYGAGPFASYEELVTWLNRKEVLSQTKSTNSFTTDRPLVFTHQDLSPRNLILDDNDKLWVIDWELAGWYPAYFEYACILADVGTPQVRIPDGWMKTMLSHLPDYDVEYRLLQSIQYALDVMPFS